MSIGRESLLRFFLPRSITALPMVIRAATAALVLLALLVPAHAQFWGDSWGGRQQPQQRQQPYNPFGGYWGDRSGGFWGDRQREAPRYPRQRERAREPEREQPPDYSRAPPATPRKDATVKIVVLGDANADWLAYGLEDAYSEKPEIGIVRKHRTDSGLISYDARRDTEWLGVAREIIAAEKPQIHRHDDRKQRSSADPREGSATATERRAEGERASGPVGYAGRPAGAAGPRAAAARGSRTASPNDA